MVKGWEKGSVEMGKRNKRKGDSGPVLGRETTVVQWHTGKACHAAVGETSGPTPGHVRLENLKRRSGLARGSQYDSKAPLGKR